MKKFQKLTIFFMFAIFMCIFFIGCSNSEKSLKNHLSEYTQTFFVCQTEDYFISINSGKRENEYVFDGKTSELVDFALVTLAFKQGNTLENIEYKIYINDIEYIGMLQKNPYKNNYMCDLKICLEDTDNINIFILNTSHNMRNLSKDFRIDYKQAQSIATEQFSNKITEITNSKKYECYLKIAFKPEVSQNTYWYYYIIADKTYNLIIDTQTGNVVANY